MQRTGSNNSLAARAWLAACSLALVAVVLPAQAAKTAPASASKGPTLERIKASGKVRFGYRADARPFSFKDESGNAAGYSVALCLKAADGIKDELGMPTLVVEWVPVTAADRFRAVQQGQVDLYCGADTETLSRRADVSFSVPIFPSGIGALLRSDASTQLKNILKGQRDTDPHWRASAGQLIQAQNFAVVPGTTAQPWLAGKLKGFRLTATVHEVASYEQGVQDVLARKDNVFFGDRAILLDAAARNGKPGELIVLDRFFTYEPLALTMARGDDNFRLVVDRAISGFYAKPEFTALYVKWFGAPGMPTQTFFAWNNLSE